ncbi:hypothetical protein [Thiomonas sp. FB-Cd]|uniref:hypothetical protein n=1 Tax=Thiomonas sp. FB-Cd TaxID=1158292 RepID=UPI0012DE518F|nr:hypothetical protein [Thiomonas sp. FB-Cd]
MQQAQTARAGKSVLAASALKTKKGDVKAVSECAFGNHRTRACLAALGSGFTKSDHPRRNE